VLCGFYLTYRRIVVGGLGVQLAPVFQWLLAPGLLHFFLLLCGVLKKNGRGQDSAVLI